MSLLFLPALLFVVAGGLMLVRQRRADGAARYAPILLFLAAAAFCVAGVLDRTT